MTVLQLLKYAFIRTGLNQSKLALKIGVSDAYISYIATRMDDKNKHLLPKTEKSTLVQDAINDVISNEIKYLSHKNINF